MKKSLTYFGEDPLLSSDMISPLCSSFGEQLVCNTLPLSPSILQFLVSSFEHELAGDSLSFGVWCGAQRSFHTTFVHKTRRAWSRSVAVCFETSQETLEQEENDAML